MKIYIDFDRTICPNSDDEIEPTVECKASIVAMKAAGHHICIFSVRSNPEETSKKFGHDRMLRYLLIHDIPYDDIHVHKPIYDVLIDDRALGAPLDSRGNIDWKQISKLQWAST
jgi:hypothetical protein